MLKVKPENTPIISTPDIGGFLILTALFLTRRLEIGFSKTASFIFTFFVRINCDASINWSTTDANAKFAIFS
jgi:hypothetical protein